MSAPVRDLLNPERRLFLTAGVAVGGGLLLSVILPLGNSLQVYAQTPAAALAPNAFIRITSDGKVTLILPYAEMGQGAYTSQVQILAEELEVDISQVSVQAAPPNEALYSNPLFGGQITGGSGSLRGAWATLRTAGAACRIILVQAAAERWKVPVSACRAQAGAVVHQASGRTLGYGPLSEFAARIVPPQAPPLKEISAFNVIGKPMRRFEGPEKVNGTAKFGIDARPDGLRYAMVAASPVFGGKLAGVDATQALKVRGVDQVVKLDDAVAVVASNTWAARKGLAALKVTWNEGANAGLTTAHLVAAADAALDKPGTVSTNIGDVMREEAAAASRYEAVFRLPILAHAAMEPINCTVHVRDGGCEVWVGSQVLGRAQKTASEAAGVPLENVVVHNFLLGGGFGRRLEFDYVTQAVLIAKQVKGPLKVTWSREEDIQHDAYRYLNHSRVTVGLDAAGRPVSWRHKVVGPNIMARFLAVYQKDGVDLDVVDAASGPYDIPNVQIEFTRNEAPEGLLTGNWRGVGPTRNVFIVESVIDQLAHRAGQDPVTFRRAMMTKAPRPLAALNLAVEKSGWGQPLPHGAGRGVAVFSGFGSHLAMVAQVQVAPSGEVTVQRMVCAVDTGVVVNPDVVRAQIEGGAIFGISALLHGRITVANGRIEQGNFNDYPVLRMKDAPVIEVHIIASAENPGGVGEPGTSGAIASVANAVFAATGKQALSLPLDPANLRSV
jgi:isoquinoline 1-oxidoreductase beta subunit